MPSSYAVPPILNFLFIIFLERWTKAVTKWCPRDGRKTVCPMTSAELWGTSAPELQKTEEF